MTHTDQQIFYASLGRALTVAMQHRNMSVAKLSGLSGEHHTTIRGIMAGRLCSLHHTVWLRRILGIDAATCMKDKEGTNGTQEIGSDEGTEATLDDFI